MDLRDVRVTAVCLWHIVVMNVQAGALCVTLDRIYQEPVVCVGSISPGEFKTRAPLNDASWYLGAYLLKDLLIELFFTVRVRRVPNGRFRIMYVVSKQKYRTVWDNAATLVQRLFTK